MARKGYYQDTKTSPHTRAYRLWNNARQRAQRSGIPFTITLDWVKERIDRCAVTGLPLSFDTGEGSGRGNPFAPSLDQIRPGEGYTPDNTQVVCWIYNNAKSVCTHDDVMKMAKALVSQG